MAKSTYTPKVELPEKGDNEALVKATNDLEAAARQRRLSLRIGWRYDLWWLKGIRQFRVLWDIGEVSVSHQNFRGELKMRYEDVLIKRQREIGLLMQIDVRPAVKRKGIGLDALRKASVGQVELDYLIGNIDIESIKNAVAEDLVDFGTVGLGVWVQDSIHLGNSPILEVIPPWELLPVPVEPTRNYDVKGICRDRWVPLRWLEGKSGLKFPKSKEDKNKLRTRMLKPGERLPGDADPMETSRTIVGGTGRTRSMADEQPNVPKKLEQYVEWVYLREYWLEGEEGRVCRYIVKAGDWICLDLDHEDLLKASDPEYPELPCMPIKTATYFGTGFYGRSFVSPLIPINRRQERMAGNLFQNVEDLDLYGIKFIPTTSGIKKTTLDNLGRLKYAFYEPDYSAWQMRPFNLEPHNMGDFPGKILEMSHGMIDRLSRESDMYSGQAPGRVDNSRTLGMLYETASIPLVPVTASIAKAFSGIYAAMLQEARRLINGSGGNAQAIKITAMDDGIAGIMFDPSQGSMTLGDKNPVPRPHEVIIDIRERMPRSQERRKAELEEALQSGRFDVVDFIAICLKENLDIPLGNESIVQAIRCQWLENMVLFGDGETPGTIEQNDVSDNHKIHLRILEDFMNRPEWKLASVAVKTKFVAHKNWHRSNLGQWAELIPDPSVLAQMPDEIAKQLAAAAPPMQPPGAPM